MENSPSVLFDALVLPDVADAIDTLAADGHTMEYLKDQFRHCKTILALGASRQLLGMAGLLNSTIRDAGILLLEGNKVDEVLPDFIAAIAAHLHRSRDCDPPKV